VVADRVAMSVLPPIPPPAGFTARLPRDYYVSVAGNEYSVDPVGIGRMIEVRAGLTHVTAWLDGKQLASHDRVWGSGQTVTDSAHVASPARLRAVFQAPRPKAEDGDLSRNLSDYDAAFGVAFTATGEVA
jgi:hypothetical protein